MAYTLLRKYIMHSKETDGFVQFGLELIDVFESVGNIRAFMQVSTSMNIETFNKCLACRES